MPNNLAISNVVNVSVATPQTGISTPNTGNLAIFTRETYASSFGTAGYKIYLSPTGVATDFGTGSKTYAMALEIFTIQPNILATGGYLVVIPFLAAAQAQEVLISFPGQPASGTFEITYGANSTTALAYNAAAATIQTALQSVSGLTSATVTGSITVATGLTVNVVSTGVGSPFTISSNSLIDSNSVSVVPVVTVIIPGSTAETLDQAIIRTQPLVAYFGVMSAEIPSLIVTKAAAAYVQSQNLIAFFVSFTPADLNSGGSGILYELMAGGYTQSRGLFYDDALGTALNFMAGYAALLLSVNYAGSNTCLTMNLKTLSGISADPNITQTLVNLSSIAGADVYPSIGGVSKVLSFGANDYSDNQVNLQAFAAALRVAYFNVLAQTNTKIPQTENGMNLIKGALQAVCQQFVTNGFLAPGTWTNPTTFGNQASLIQNVAQFGYYIYSSPISQQAPSARAARQAPPVQIAAKYAGAEQTGTVVVYVNP